MKLRTPTTATPPATTPRMVSANTAHKLSCELDMKSARYGATSNRRPMTATPHVGRQNAPASLSQVGEQLAAGHVLQQHVQSPVVLVVAQPVIICVTSRCRNGHNAGGRAQRHGAARTVHSGSVFRNSAYRLTIKGWEIMDRMTTSDFIWSTCFSRMICHTKPQRAMSGSQRD